MNDESLASCPESSSAKIRQFTEQVNATTNMNQARASATYESEFLSAGLWLTTVVFLSLTISFAVLSGFFSIVNIWFNPTRFLISAFGLYVWNGIAAGLCVLTMIFWSSLYLIFISNNIGITDTLRNTAHYSSKELAHLGFSFWILFATIFCHLINIALVYYRNFLLQREPRAPVITVSKNDSTILVY
jgi:clarin